MMNDSSIFQSMEPLFKRVEELGKIPRIAICVGTCVVLVAVIAFLFIKPSYDEINQLQQTQQSLGQQLEIARVKASKLPTLKREWKMKEAEFRKVMRALPEKKEIPSLLTSISQSGQDTGLKFLLFEPRNNNNKEFYGEIPVGIKLTGNFHNTVKFFDKVTGLNRIVNIRDIKMGGFKDGKVTTECTAVTYKFIEQKAQKKSK